MQLFDVCKSGEFPNTKLLIIFYKPGTEGIEVFS